MKPTIEENKKSVLMDLLNQTDDKLSALFHAIEDDETVSDESFRMFESYIERLYELITNLKDQIIFS